MRTVRSLSLTLVLLGLFLLPGYPAQAQSYDCFSLNYYEWKEIRTPFFAIIFTADYEELSQLFYALYATTLESEYQRFQLLFDASLPLPISIRIYPTEEDYYCLNALAPKAAGNGTHSHIGSREIALIGENIAADLAAWQSVALNSFRYEMGVLYTIEMTQKKAPPGLLAGVGGYAQEPSAAELANFANQYQQQGSVAWDDLWNNPDIQSDPYLTSQATSIIAYLTDEYGWLQFIQLVKALPTARSPREALQEVYAVQFSDLQAEWALYLPLYYQERWQFHAWYGFDLEKYARLLEAGAYSEASQQLKNALGFLELLGDQPKIQQAQELLQIAQTGQQAVTLVAQARRDLQAGLYTESLAAISQAQTLYAQIGDTARTQEMEIYQRSAQQLLEIFSSLGQGSSQSLSNAQLLSARQLLVELGDEKRLALINQAIQQNSNQQQSQALMVSLGVTGLCVALLVYRFILLRKPTPPEAQL